MMQRLRTALPAAAAAAFVLAAAQPAAAAQPNGADGGTIRIGQTMPYSGPASAYGVIGKAEQAYFRMLNDRGGINGRRVELISLDDGYSPPKALEQTRRLVERDGVLLVFGTLGTAPNTAIHAYLNRRGVPQLFVAAGSSRWGDPKRFPWTMGWIPTYRTEARIYARHILDTVATPRIAVLMQNDDYGREYLAGLREGLGGDADRLVVAVASYESTDATVDSQVLQLKASGANVLLDAATPKFAAQAIRKAAEIGWKPAIYLNNVSASVEATLKPAGFANAQGVITADYRKDPADPQWADAPDYVAWKAWMESYMPGADPLDANAAYGYASAATLAEVLRRCGDDLSRANVMRQAAGLHGFVPPMLQPGIRIDTGPDDYFPIETLRLQRFQGDHWVPFGPVLSAGAD